MSICFLLTIVRLDVFVMRTLKPTQCCPIYLNSRKQFDALPDTTVLIYEGLGLVW